MKFSEEQTFEVKLHHGDLGDLGKARLRIGGEWGVVATVGLLATLPRLNPDHPLDFVSATTKDGHAFTLCECRIHDFSLGTFLVYGNVSGNRFLQMDILARAPDRLLVVQG